MKRGTIHLVSPLFLAYCYFAKISIDFCMIMKSNINKKMVERMKRKESLESKLGGNQLAQELK
jgi:hypothetical protein